MGRAPEAANLFAEPGDGCLSRTHALLEVKLSDLTVWVRDNHSRNGTFINRTRLVPGQRRQLLAGDVLRVGDSFVLWRVQQEAAEGPAAEVPELVGVSPALAQLRATVARVAPSPASVLLVGETGTGKEVVANAVHRLSGRPGQHVAVNCAAVPESLAESLFFGHTRGAFTGAAAQSGYFAAADRGTLFLDEVGELSAALQAKLLRLLEQHEVTPVGATKAIPCDVRIVAATHRDLEASIRAGRFREDLYARLADVVLRLPPLRERREDILLLLEHQRDGRLTAPLPADLIESLLCYPWPRNVRELLKIGNHLRLFGPDAALMDRLQTPIVQTLDAEPLPAKRADPDTSPGPQRPRKDKPFPSKTEPPSKQRLEALMSLHRGVIQDVASALGYSRRQVGRWLDRHQIDRSRFRQEQEP